MRLIDADRLLMTIASGIRVYDGKLRTEDIVHSINNEPTINQWISGEQLPATDDDVLVYFEYFRYGSYNRLYRTIGIGNTFNGEWSGFVNGQSGWTKLKIIAWMPLPEPPKEE